MYEYNKYNMHMACNINLSRNVAFIQSLPATILRSFHKEHRSTIVYSLAYIVCHIRGSADYINYMKPVICRYVAVGDG